MTAPKTRRPLLGAGWVIFLLIVALAVFGFVLWRRSRQ